MRRLLLSPRRNARAFTLMEIMVAVVIFSLVMSALFVSFRTGVKAYDIGITHAEADQLARYCVQQVTRDLRNVFYREPLSYNVTRRQRESLQGEREQQYARSGLQLSEAQGETMPETGPAIDVSFRAADGGDTDEITFVTQQTQVRFEDRRPWGLARIHYQIQGDNLYRAVDDVTVPETDEEGNEVPKPTMPRVDKIGKYLKALDFKFGYFYDGEWHVAQDWDSEVNQYRNPSDEEEELEQQLGVIQTTAADGTTSTGEEQKQLDELPAWVEVTFTFFDSKNPEKEKTYVEIVQIPASEETYVPEEAQDDRPAMRSAFGAPGRRAPR